MAKSNKAKFERIDMTQDMLAVDKGKYTFYSTYRFSGGHQETYKDKINNHAPRFVGRI